MNDINNKIIELIKNNESLNNICSKLNITEKQFYVRLKNIIINGYNIEPIYYYNSDTLFKFRKDDVSSIGNVTINYTKNSGNVFRCLVISDMHIGNIDSDINLVNPVYEYAIKNGIKYILICGDNIEGDYTNDKKTIKNYEDQTEYFVKKYPYDKNITNFMILGNHDYHSLKQEGYSVFKKIKNSRYDIVPIGNGQGNVNIKNDSLILFHKLSPRFEPNIKDEKIILSGHGHMMKTKIKNGLWICVPSLSYVSTDKTKNLIPGFIDLKIVLEKSKFEYVEAKHMIITPEVYNVSESRCKIKSLFNDREEI